MILYLDSSALMKRYVVEIGSQEVVEAIAQADIAGTVVITRAEVAAAFAKAVRMAALTQDEAQTCLERFRRDWPQLVRTRVTEATVARRSIGLAVSTAQLRRHASGRGSSLAGRVGRAGDVGHF